MNRGRGAWESYHLVLYMHLGFKQCVYILIEEGNGNPLQYSCLENPRDGGGLVGCLLWGRTESDTTEAT